MMSSYFRGAMPLGSLYFLGSSHLELVEVDGLPLALLLTSTVCHGSRSLCE